MLISYSHKMSLRTRKPTPPEPTRAFLCMSALLCPNLVKPGNVKLSSFLNLVSTIADSVRAEIKGCIFDLNGIGMSLVKH